MFDLNETKLTGDLAADLTTTTVATAKGRKSRKAANAAA